MSSLRTVLVSALVSLAAAPLAACGDGGEVVDPGRVCVGSEAPPVPVLLAPADGQRDVFPDELALAADLPAGTLGADYEIWSVKDGQPDALVWSATFDGPPPAQVRLGDGAFVAGVLGLEEYGDYSARVRYRAVVADCHKTSDYSPRRAFRMEDGSAALFDDSEIKDVEIELPPESVAAINAQAYPPGCVPWKRDYQRGSITIDGVRYDDVGVKVKGGCGSARNLDQKAGLKVKLNWDDPEVPGCPEKRRHAGQSTFTFNNMVQDPSMVHERLGYALHRQMGVPVPRAAHVRVSVNGELYGVYLHLESHERRFLARNFQDNDGMLYEGTYWCDLLSSNVSDDDSGCLTREFSPDVCDMPDADADPQTYEPLRGFLGELDALDEGGFYPASSGFIDMDRFLAMWAVDAVLGHWDGYEFGIVNNYRIYHDPESDLWTLMPSGIDQTFGSDVDPWSAGARLARACLDEPACEAAFAAKLSATVTAFEQLAMEDRAAAIYAQVMAEISVAQARNVDLGTLSGAYQSTLTFIRDRPARIRQYLAQHGY